MKQITVSQEYDILCVYIEKYPSDTDKIIHDEALNECKNQAYAFTDNGWVVCVLTRNGIKVAGYFEKRNLNGLRCKEY